jgi:hypothetical protein
VRSLVLWVCTEAGLPPGAARRRLSPGPSVPHLLISYPRILVALTTHLLAYLAAFRPPSILITPQISRAWIEHQVPRLRLAAIGIIFLGVVPVGPAD